MSKKPNNWDKGFVQGYVCACATSYTEHGEDTIVEDCLRGIYKSVDDLKKHEVEESDIETLMPVIEEIERKRELVNAECAHVYAYKILYDHTAADVCTECGNIKKQ